MLLDLAQANDIVAPISKFDSIRARDGCLSRVQAQRLLGDEVNICVLPLKEFAASSKFPSYRRDTGKLVRLSDVRRSEAIIIFISRRNCRARRDSVEEFKHSVAGAQYIYDHFAFGMPDCYVWYDALAEKDERYFADLDFVMSSSDCVLTPIFDDEFVVKLPPSRKNTAEPPKIVLQLDDMILDNHLQWQKSRVEMHFGTFMPSNLDPQRMRELRGDLFVALSTFGRPHFCYNKDSPKKVRAISVLPFAHAGIDVAVCNPRLGQLKLGAAGKSMWLVLCDFLESHYVPPNYERARYQGPKDDEGLFCGHGKLFFENGGVHTGEFKDNLFHGFGKLVSPSGGTYEGAFRGGKIHGEGRMIYGNGDMYLGSYVENLRQGRGKNIDASGNMYQGDYLADSRMGEGEMVFVNGNRYVGSYCFDEPHGYGQLTFSNGDRFVGTFAAGMRTGEGCFTYQNGNEYKGSWAKNVRSGAGVLTMASGAVYTGAFLDDRMCGGGQLLYADGNLYHGSFENNLPHGSGRFEWANGDVYVGSYKVGLQNGQGTLNYFNGSSYVGAWWDSRKHGIGKYMSSEGHSYYGDYAKDFMHGNGRFEWANGDSYEGHFVRNQMHGKGKLRHKSGNIFVGEFKEDMKDGKGKLYNANGVIYNGYWRAGLLKAPLGQKVEPRGITLKDENKQEEPEDPNQMKLLDDEEESVDRSVMKPSSNFRNKFGPGDAPSELPDFLVGKIKPLQVPRKDKSGKRATLFLPGNLSDSLTLDSGSTKSLGSWKG
jgi:hypothetical protein